MSVSKITGASRANPRSSPVQTVETVPALPQFVSATRFPRPEVIAAAHASRVIGRPALSKYQSTPPTI
jgi:hypothetical protein